MNFDCALILGSSSPRRQALMKMAGYRFTVMKPTCNEAYPADLSTDEIAGYLAQKKAVSIKQKLHADEVLLAADTVVVLQHKIFNKPTDRDEAISMLSCLSGMEHTVITGVCILDQNQTVCFSDQTEVTFRKLQQEEIIYYVDHFEPFDKAGGYGVQDWIGIVGIEQIKGSYSTVMGLPMHKVYTHLKKF